MNLRKFLIDIKLIPITLSTMLLGTSMLAMATDSDITVARIGKYEITLSQLDMEGEDDNWDAKQKLYDTRKEALNNWTEETLLKVEADSRSISVEELLAKETNESHRVSDEVIAAIAYGILEADDMEDQELIEVLRNSLENGYAVIRKKALMRELRNKYKATVTLPRPTRYTKSYSPIQDGLISFGPKDAAVQLVYFYDFNCGYCRDADEILARIQHDYSDQVNILLRIAKDEVDNDERRAEAAAQCAAKQDAFWVFHQELYPMDADYPESDLIDVARNLNLDLSEFKSCLHERELIMQQRQEPADLASLRIRGTPTYIINGKKHTGVLEYVELQEIIANITGNSSSS